MAVNAEWLVEAMDGLNPMISKQWIGLILLPAISSVAGTHFPYVSSEEWLMYLDTSTECATAMNVSVKDQLTLSVSVAIGSTIVSHSTKIQSSTLYSNYYLLIANRALRHSIDGRAGLGDVETPRSPLRSFPVCRTSASFLIDIVVLTLTHLS